MKKIILFFAAILFFANAQAQLNMTLRDEVQYNVALSDVWGWAHEPTGKEYAIVGLNNGVSVVDVTDPDNAVEVGLAPGLSSTWRDIKTWGDYAYITNEEGDGLMVIYLGDLPSGGEISYSNWTPNIPGLGTLISNHNIYIDEFGYAYLAGSNLNNGGMLIIDVFTTPGSPEFVAAAPPVYSHDVYVRDNKMYSSEIYDGVFTIYDVTDKNNIVELGGNPTPFNFTHNSWLNDAGDVLFTTDELANAPIGAYDVSDPTDIEELDQFAPYETLGDGVIPHNVHVWQDWLIISYYSDGGIVVDASEPDNLIEVGNFDTFFGGGQGFNGSWGAYPFLPSETILLSDIGNGLYIVTPTYVRACRVEGTVTDINTNEPIAGATVVIEADQGNSESTDFTGEYKTGIATAGTYNVTYSASGYNSETLSLSLENGTTIMQDVQLGSLTSYALTGLTVKDEDGLPLGDVLVTASNNEYSFTTTSDVNGNFILSQVFSGDYTIVAGKWGYEYATQTVNINADATVELALRQGYQDDFAFDYGWQTASTAQTGDWELGEPIGTTTNFGEQSNTDNDLPNDFGEQCYVTGNGGGNVITDDVDNGIVTLTSPSLDLTTYTEPIISYSTWFFNAGGNGNPNDELEVSLSNGTTTIILETISNSAGAWRPESVFNLAGMIDFTDNMRISFETSDFQGSGHLVEGAVDGFRVTEGVSSVIQPVGYQVEMTASPNPFNSTSQINFVLNTDFDNARILVNNQLGQTIETIILSTKTGSVELGERLVNGLYFVHIEVDGKLVATEKILKVK